ncbi:hydroxymethylglutaryl-CoA lyase [Sediminibacillus albus]|uniref:Hydroxymethylglutaryl-CoA lyase n=2 Tax=Sediminibacillus albus TaxID=407036 RepID=A0A1G8VWU4_9BACI|nr:hydroxymethylglutaryl-CoA lyase [Sediminibacillus albus]
MNIPEEVKIKEVGPRDGLQNEPEIIPTEEKINWINALSNTGISYIEISSFVHPKWIPQLSDAFEVGRGIIRNPNVTYAALVPNSKGLERALAVGIDEVSVFMSASETHNKKNINKSIADTFPVLKEVAETAKQEGKTVRGYVSTVFGCPYEGDISFNKLLNICDKLFEMGIEELSLGDTVGVADPLQVSRLIKDLSDRYSAQKFALHFHDTRGTAMANVLAAMLEGINTFDASLGGLGGCPYAKGASGNLATDDLVYMLHQMNVNTGVNHHKLIEAAKLIQRSLAKSLPSRQMQLISHEEVSQ